MSIARLAEAVILQAISDLFDRNHRRESLRFLTGEGFRIAAEMADIGARERAEILNYLEQAHIQKRSIPGSSRTGVKAAGDQLPASL